VLVLTLGKPSRRKLDELLERASSAGLTYADVGATRSPSLPVGYRHDRYERVLGSGDAVFDGATRGLRAWRAHVGAGVDVVPDDAPVELGQTVVLAVPFGPAWAVAPCRVVYVVEEADRWGFAYGTLPGHPEQGEESFVVEGDQLGSVTFRITAFSRPAALMARVGAPVTRAVQRRVTTHYLDALADAADWPHGS
jgi:uncharacterized protein (UPF0548 family)